MPQIDSGKSPAWVAGEIVTAVELNGMIDAAKLSTGAILEQTNIAAGTVASNDSILLYDLSATALRSATINDILGSLLPVTASTVTATSVVTSVVNAEANSDIVLTPNDGINVTGKTFSSIDGITATIASTAHGLVTGQNVTITASNSAYSGTYKITVTTVDAFTYVLFPVSTAASGTCSYIREGSVRINGELTVSGGLNIAGATTLSGSVNFTGSVQFNGNNGYVLTEIVEEIVPPITLNSVANAWTVLFTSASYTKPSNEIWHIELEGVLRFDNTGYASYKLKRTAGALDVAGSCQVDLGSYGGTGKFSPLYISANENAGTSFTSTYTFEMSYPLTGYILGVGYTAIFAVTVPATKFRIYKYKTA